MSQDMSTWFIYAKGNPKTNRLVGLVLGESGEEEECNDQLCEDGKLRNLWRCPSWEFVENFKRAADANKYPYDIYVREGKHGPVRRWPFDRQQEVQRPLRRHKTPVKFLLEEAEAAMNA